MHRQAHHLYEFGSFRLDPEERLLWQDGEAVPLTQKAFAMLQLLVESGGSVVGKDDFIKELWPDTFVEEGILTVNISILRKALGDSKSESQYIETVPRRGYRFVASVRELNDRVDLIVEEHSQTSITIAREEETLSKTTEKAAAQRAFTVTGWLLRNRLMLVSGLIVVVLTAVTYSIWRSSGSVKTSPGVRSIAVLPFKPVDAANRDEAFELGMADTLITRLSHLRAMTVRPTSAVRKYMGLNQDSIAAGREQMVDLVLDGSIQRSGDKMRVTIRVMSVKDGSAVWTYKCDQVCNDVFQVQDSISEDVAQALMLKLTPEEKYQLAKHYTENKQAYELYLKGRFHCDQTYESPEEFEKGIEYFQQAVEIEPTYALAYAGLADASASLAWYAHQSHMYSRALVAAEKAVELDETLAEAHAALALANFIYVWDWSEAEKHFKRAIELDPNRSRTHAEYSHFLVSMGHLDDGLAESKLALELDPISVESLVDRANTLRCARRYDEVIDVSRKGIELFPDSKTLHGMLSIVLYDKGLYDEALGEYVKSFAADYGYRIRKVYGVSGWRGIFNMRIGQLMQQQNVGISRAFLIGRHYAQLGEKERALEWLQKGIKERSQDSIELRSDPRLDSLRSDPRFTDLLSQMNLAP